VYENGPLEYAGHTKQSRRNVEEPKYCACCVYQSIIVSTQWSSSYSHTCSNRTLFLQTDVRNGKSIVVPIALSKNILIIRLVAIAGLLLR
jgi:hypothetical protein